MGKIISRFGKNIHNRVCKKKCDACKKYFKKTQLFIAGTKTYYCSSCVPDSLFKHYIYRDNVEQKHSLLTNSDQIAVGVVI